MVQRRIRNNLDTLSNNTPRLLVYLICSQAFPSLQHKEVAFLVKVEAARAREVREKWGGLPGRVDDEGIAERGGARAGEGREGRSRWGWGRVRRSRLG